jgi:ribosome maturation factor RimP
MESGQGGPQQGRQHGSTGGQVAIERTVTGLGYDLVEVERAPRGLLRVLIDRVPGHAYPDERGAGEFVTIDDCEVVTRQLQLSLEVEGVDYARLEVSSPGLDRPLKRVADFERFAGQEIELTLKLPFKGRRHWRGTLGRGESGWTLALAPGSSAAAGEGGSELSFLLAEVREARLVPVIDFKGRARGRVEERSQER